MPERIFKYVENVDDLKSLIKDLAQAITSGSTTQLKNGHTGWLKMTGPISQTELRKALMDARYEIYARGCGSNGDANCKKLEPKNPYQEKVMRVEAVNQTSPYMLPPLNAYYF